MTVNFKRRLYARIEDNSDDAYQTGSTVNISSSAADHRSTGDLIGLRFIGVGVAKGATITRAVLRYDVGSGAGNPNLQIHCQKESNPATFTTASNDIGSRPLTTASTFYQASGLAGNSTVYTPDFSAAVQEVVDLPGWASGNAMAVLLKSNANTTFSVRTRNASLSVRATLIIEYTMPKPVTPSVYSVSTIAASSTSTQSVTVDIPSAGGTRLYAFVHTARYSSDYAGNAHAVSSATLNGSAMTLLDSVASHSGPSHYHILELYEVVDPLDNGGNPTSQTLAITLSKSVNALCITVVVVTGVTDRGVAVDTTAAISSGITLDVDTDRNPGLILAGGHLRRRDIDLEYVYATDDAGMAAKYQNKSGFNDIVAFVGGADAPLPGTYRMGWSWSSVEWSGSSESRLIAIPLYGRVEVAEAEFSAFDPVVVYGAATLDGLLAAAEFSGADPHVIVGSIPPVQVSGRGRLYLSTSSRRITVCLLATNGTDWVVTDSGGGVEQLSVQINRRSGYLTPV